MTTDGDTLQNLDEAVERIGALAERAWEHGSGFAEVVEEVVYTFEELEAVRPQLEAILPSTWCAHLPFQERLRNLVELRRAWLSCVSAHEARIAELEAKVKTMGNPPLAVDPDALVRLRLLLRGEPRAVVITGEIIGLLKGVFGEATGPTHIEPALLCPVCEGLGETTYENRFVLCLRCDGDGKVPDVEGMRLRIAELEHERGQLRGLMTKAARMMAWMRSPYDAPPRETWEALELALGDYRNCGYEYSDHPDDFTAPTWSASDPEPVEEPCP